MSAAGAGECGVRWCHETAGHDGPHRSTLLDLNGVDVDSARPSIFQVNVEGLSSRVKALVLVTAAHQTALSWRQVDELRETLASAHRRWSHRTNREPIRRSRFCSCASQIGEQPRMR